MKKKVVNKSALARELQVSRSSIYYVPRMELRDQQLKEQILSVLEEHPFYGYRRIALHLERNEKPVQRVMNLFKIRPIMRKAKRPFKPEDRGQEPSGYCNYLKHLCPILEGVLWASDFTYFWFIDQFYYLATIIDVHTREILGTAFGSFHNKELVMEALKDALKKHKPPQYIHSDQGSEYSSEAYTKLAESHGIIISMSAKGKPWENGFQESFYSQFKLEVGSPRLFSSLGELMEAIYHQIHYYNHHRIHTALKMPPKKYALQQLILRDKLF